MKVFLQLGFGQSNSLVAKQRKRKEMFAELTSEDEGKLPDDERVETSKEGPNGPDPLLPQYLQTLTEGKEVCGDSYIPFSKPVWFDEERFRRGQKFAVQHMAGVFFAELLCLMMGLLFSFEGTFKPLIFTGNSDTPFKSFKRYLSTVLHVKSWYEGDIWDSQSLAHRNLKAVRTIHDIVRKRLHQGPEEEVARRMTLEDDDRQTPLWTDLREELLEDFKSTCPFPSTSTTTSSAADPSRKDIIHLNQCDMAKTQFGFAGLILIFPKMFGIHRASKDEMDGFAHFWRTIGFLLGMEDRYNLCDGDLEIVQQRCRDLLHYWIKPGFSSISCEGIHMARCVTAGLSYYTPNTISFELLTLYMCKVLDIQAPRLLASLSYWQYFIFYHTVFVFWFLMRLPGMLVIYNWVLATAIKYAQDFSPEHLNKLKQKVYPYERVKHCPLERPKHCPLA